MVYIYESEQWLTLKCYNYLTTYGRKTAMASSKNIVFDVVGTLVGYDKLYQAIEERLGDRLKERNVKTDMFGYMWACNYQSGLQRNDY